MLNENRRTRVKLGMSTACLLCLALRWHHPDLFNAKENIKSSYTALQSRPCATHELQVLECREALAAEVAQHKAVQQLASMFCKLAGEQLGSKWFQHFEAWLFSRRGSKQHTGPHSILPLEAASNLAQQELQRKLVATGMTKALAESICIELNRLPTHLHKKVGFSMPHYEEPCCTPKAAWQHEIQRVLAGKAAGASFSKG